MKREKLSYLGAPYNHQDPSVKRQRLAVVNYISLQLMKQGTLVFSPLSHNLSIDFNRHFDSWEAWQRLDLNFLSRCDALLILTLDGWEQSVGLKAEREYAEKIGLPIEYLNPPSHEQILQITQDFHLNAVP